MSRDRLHAAEATAIGAGMLGGASAANYGLDRMLERKKIKTPPRAIFNEAKRLVRGGGKTAVHPLHAPYVAGKVATTSVRAVGLPLAAYGAFNLISPGDKVARVRLKDDVVKPTVRTATGYEQANRAKNRIKTNREARKRTQMAKSALTDKEYNQLQHRKTTGRNISLVAGSMGLTALGLRAPELARATTKVPRVGKLKALQHLASREKGATKASNALGVAAIGTGSVGSFNYAAQQKLEQKKFAKALPKYGVVNNLGRVRVVGQHDTDLFHVVDSKDIKRFIHRSRIKFLPENPRKGVTQMKLPFEKALSSEQKARAKARARSAGRPYPNAFDNMVAGGAPWKKGVHKADDRFLRKYRQHISPEAEAGYTYLKRGRNKAAGSAAFNAALTPINAHSSVSGFRRGGKAGVAWGATGAGLTALTGTGAVKQGRKAVRWDRRMAGIESKAQERAAAGVYGRGREITKGLIPVIRPRIPLAARKPAIRSGHVATSVLGRKYTVRGSVR